jgi:tetratricopeptide (TPR) repeat protein
VAEEAEGREHGAEAGGQGVDPAAMTLALGAATQNERVAAKVEAFLEKQTRVAGKQEALLDLEIEDLRREDTLRHWSLRVRHISDVMKVTFEITAAFFGIAIVVATCAALWAASRDDSLIIESFSVPPDMANRGLTGQAVAAQLQDRIAAMQASTDSARPPSSYSNNWGNDIKVQIPDTGVSISEFYRILTLWLGHQTRITGEVFRTGNGIAITARAGGDGGATIQGPETNFDSLFQRAAEAVFEQTQPYRYGVYLLRHDRLDEAQKVFEKLAANSSASEKAWAENGLANVEDTRGNLRASAAWSWAALALERDFALTHWTLAENELTLGHDEEAVRLTRELDGLTRSPNPGLTERSRMMIRHSDTQTLASEFGNFASVPADARVAEQLPDYNGVVENSWEAEIEALGLLHDARAMRSRFAEMPFAADDATVSGREAALAQAEIALKDWKGAVRDAADAETTAKRAGSFSSSGVRVGVWPFLTRARFETGNRIGAFALIARTPLDCYACVDMRGNIDAAAKNWGGAAYWFADAARQAPSLPLAYSDWGAMLLAKGDLDGAIAKFEIANQKGPHFADPLEMWGEALIRQNRSDLALAKFAEANKYAPNWGRLHLKWGEALLWSGKTDDAQKQFAIAPTLDLPPSEKSELARVRGPHG